MYKFYKCASSVRMKYLCPNQGNNINRQITMAILHSVYFYLKEDAPSGLADKMKSDILTDLAAINTVRSMHAGGPLGVDRDVVDNDYAMSIQAFFEDRDGLNSYQQDPVHLSFVGKYKQYWDHIKVFDTHTNV